MIPMIAVPNVQFQPPVVQTEFVVGVPTEVSPLSRLPFGSVPSSGSVVQFYNNTRGGSGYAPSRAQLAASQIQSNNANTALFQLPAGVQLGPAFHFTSQFMAQVMGQGGVANDNGLVEAFYQSASQSQQVAQADDHQTYSLNYLLGAANKAKALSTPKHHGAQLVTAPTYQVPESKARSAFTNYAASFARNQLFLEHKDQPVNAVTL